jgi:hypothetical protein
MNGKQRLAFWDWLFNVLIRRLENEGYCRACPEGAAADLVLLKIAIAAPNDFESVLPIIERSNIPGFK